MTVFASFKSSHAADKFYRCYNEYCEKYERKNKRSDKESPEKLGFVDFFIKEKGLEEFVNITGQVSADKVSLYLNDADVYIPCIDEW